MKRVVVPDSAAPLGAQIVPGYARRPHFYLVDSAGRKRVGELLSALWQARRHHLADWMRSCVGGRNPFLDGMPWISWRSIDYLEKQLKPGTRVFEYGGGGSTLYFLSKGCQVTTVEGNPEWAFAIRDRVAELGAAGRLDLRIFDTQGDNPASREKYIEAVRAGGPWDLIVVDGVYRRECFAESRRWLSSGGFMLFDNTDFPDYSNAHELAPELQRIVCRGLGYGRPGPTETTIFLQTSK